ncbi:MULTISPECIES: hypothetical protein [unclassified Minwuia]|jgi:hypothetical protein|uniref:hypothetical protein n=1 Tax=unclassified Minwuia TaxID=2618799 RepID=UPI0024795B6A|nr:MULTISPECIES: hypothetical protein [unclassified Minwuia]
MHMTAIQAETERNRLDRSARCAEKHHRRARTRRLRGLIRSVSAAGPAAGAAQDGKCLSSRQNSATFTSGSMPLGEHRMTFIKTLCILTAFVLISNSTSAQTLEKVFGKGDWEFHFDSSHVCVAATASGRSTLMVYTDKENSQINYLIFSGTDALQSATLFIDDKKYDLSVSDNIAVSLDERRPEIFSDMRAGSNAVVVATNEVGEERELAFSLMGFTASVLKMDDYCDVSIDFEPRSKAPSVQFTGQSEVGAVDRNLGQSEIKTTDWGFWLTNTNENHFDKVMWNKWYEYASAFDVVERYINTYRSDVDSELLREGREAFRKYPDNFQCDYNGRRITLGPTTLPGALNEDCTGGILYMKFPKITFDDFECIWAEGDYYYDACYFQWIHQEDRASGRPEEAIRVRVTFPALKDRSLFPGDRVLVSGEISKMERFQPSIGITKLTKFSRIEEMPVKLIDLHDDKIYFEGEEWVVQVSIEELMGNLTGVKKTQHYLQGFFYHRDFEGRFAAAFSEKANRMIPPPPTVSREEYVRDVLVKYNIAIACADFGRLGEFTSSYLKSRFSGSPKNDLSPRELDQLSELEIIKIRTLANDEETCGAMLLGLMFDPSGGADMFFSKD